MRRNFAFLAWLSVTAGLFGAPATTEILTPEKINPKLRQMAARAATLPVLIVLTHQPHREILERIEGASRLRMAVAEARGTLDSALLEVRKAEFAEIEAAIAPDQDAMEARLLALGAVNITRYLATNMLAADIPAAALAALETDPSIAVVFPAETRKLHIVTSVPALGAPSFWSLGDTGAGQSIGILDTGVATSHPAFTSAAFTSKVFLTYGSIGPCFLDSTASTVDVEGHGTHIAGIVTSRGATGGHENYLGVAKGLGTTYNLKVAYRAKSSFPCNGGGESDSRDVLAGLDWAIANAPSLKIFNYSSGESISSDDDDFTRQMDARADLYGLTITVAAGNSGPAASTVSSPAIGYNIISVANWDDFATVTRADDLMGSHSSRGPTTGGRYKPDIAAPGSAALVRIISTGLNNDWVSSSGTSMAAPHIAGAAALLRNEGVTSALAAKAILINTTDSPGWQSDRGWGFANLATAAQQLNYFTGSVTSASQPGHFALYRGSVASGLRATLVWNRHITAGTSYFNNLDLYLYNAALNTLMGASTSTLQNVEQVTASGGASLVLKVTTPTTALVGTTTEPFALALSSGGFTSAGGPSLSVACSAPASVPFLTSFVVSCTATNTGDLAAFGVSGTLNLPAGFTGAQPVFFGTVQPGGSSSPVSITLTAPGSAGNYSLSITGSSASYGETFSASSSFPVVVTGVTATTIQTNPAGLAIVVDGVSLAAPQTFNWPVGSSHSIGVVSPQSSGGTRYL